MSKAVRGSDKMNLRLAVLQFYAFFQGQNQDIGLLPGQNDPLWKPTSRPKPIIF